MEKGKLKMKPYLAHFVSEKKTIPIRTEGISHVHAHARAWIKFMRTKEFLEDTDAWELGLLLDLYSSPSMNVNPFRQGVH